MKAHPVLLPLALALLALSGCEPYDRPRRPLPGDFQVRRLEDGALWGPAELRGRPWVLVLWVPK